MKKLLLSTVIILFSVFYACEEESVYMPVIPAPVQLQITGAAEIIVKQVAVHSDKEISDLAGYLEKSLKNINKIPVKSPVSSDSEKTAVDLILVLDSAITHAEGYHLVVSGQGIKISARSSAGIFYGIQTFLQLIEASGEGAEVKLPHLRIEDYPRFSWRGMHLDVSRHFFPVSFIKRYIDILALHKLNVFHWHLTDDQGWRIEIKKYPKLTENGAWRKGTGKEEWTYFVEPAEHDKPQYGGFYTQDEIREIVAYAAKRYITVVPEIEMPGHSWAALAAYPHLSCSGEIWKKPDDVAFEFSDPFCAGNERVFELLESVISEVTALFPSEYIHIGGDEAKKTPWETCPKCQKRMKDELLHSTEELQSYFIKRIEKIVASKGRKIIGWDEILEGGLAPGAAVMSWRGEGGGIEAAHAGHSVVMTPGEYLYFNKPQFDSKLEGLSYSVTNLKTVYNYNPMSMRLSGKEKDYIMGAQACLWSEYVQSPRQAESSILPRLAALAEVLWTPDVNRTWPDFKLRLGKYINYLDAHNYNYFIPPPDGIEDDLFVGEEFAVTMRKPYPQAKIYYSVDGEIPTIQSLLYNNPVVINKNTIIKAVTVMPSGRSSSVISASFRKTEYLAAHEVDPLENGLGIKIYEGKINSLDNFTELKEIAAFAIDKIEIPVNVPEDDFGLEYNGFIKIPVDGIYKFSTSSDDGSRLLIDNKVIVDNDGVHGMTIVSGAVALKKGYHYIKVQYFEAIYGQGLLVQMAGPGLDKKELPGYLLFH